MTRYPDCVNIVEVGPRDGLQSEAKLIATEDKLAYIGKLVEAGLSVIEIASFVSPKAVPQMADAFEVATRLPLSPGVTFAALVPNYRGLEQALEAGIKRIAVFTAASETFCEHNLHMSVDHSLRVYGEVLREARRVGMTARAYISTCFVCPFEGEVPKEKVRAIALRLLELDVDEIALSDTIGAAAPNDIHATVGYCLERIPVRRIALHLHDTYGTALANVLAGLELGVRTFDASTGGIGGCPFAPGAAGNLATEDLVYMLDRMGISTGAKLDKVVEAAHLIADRLNRTLTSRVAAHFRPRRGLQS